MTGPLELLVIFEMAQELIGNNVCHVIKDLLIRPTRKLHLNQWMQFIDKITARMKMCTAEFLSLVTVTCFQCKLTDHNSLHYLRV